MVGFSRPQDRFAIMIENIGFLIYNQDLIKD